MIRKVLEGCPSCAGSLEIGEMHCTVCETEIRARYRPCDFCGLTEEQSTFLHIFVMSRGNLSEVEKRLGVSYPTVRAKLDEVLERLAGTAVPAPPAVIQRQRGVGRAADPMGERVAQPPPALPAMLEERRHILEAVARREIDADEGQRRIRELGERHEEAG